jgi:hypothetical protein
MTIAYENLDLIPTLLILVTELKKEVEILKSSKIKLRTNREVQEFLNIGRSTLHNYIKNGVLVENTHYKYEKTKIIFISEAIIKFKKYYVKHSKAQHKSTVHVNNFMTEFVA